MDAKECLQGICHPIMVRSPVFSPIPPNAARGWSTNISDLYLLACFLLNLVLFSQKMQKVKTNTWDQDTTTPTGCKGNKTL